MILFTALFCSSVSGSEDEMYTQQLFLPDNECPLYISYHIIPGHYIFSLKGTDGQLYIHVYNLFSHCAGRQISVLGNGWNALSYYGK